MTGFIRGLFGGRKQQSAETTIKPQSASQAYFLDDDAAKTLGDIDYMRKSKQIRHTFPKVEGFNVGGTEKVHQVSAMEDRDYMPEETTPSSSTPSSSSLGSQSFQRRNAKTDTNMDMFRNMAKNIKRR